MNTQADSNPPGEWYCPSCEKQFPVGDRCPDDGTKLVKLAVRIDPFIGRELDGRYTILEKLGQGGMGAVYRSSQHSVGRDCAIKVISSNLVSDPDVIKRFLREAKLASRLSHPNAVAVLDFGQTEDGVFYLVMELVHGRTLDQVFKAEKQFKPERVVRIGTQVCDALEGAHALQIVHRDLKPSNIMVLHRGRDLVKVLDFGLAKSVAPDQTSTTMTNAGALLGTPAFMPPELALGEPCDGRADLYSLGCVLYLLGSGRLPFQSTSAHELIAMHATEKAPPMTGVPAALGRVIDRLLEKDPAARYQSATDAREALEAAIDGRVYTPAAGVPVGSETNPSIGPFPKTTADLVHDDTMPPSASAIATAVAEAGKRRAMTPTDIERLVTGETLAAVNDTIVHQRASAQALPAPAATTAPPAPAKKRWLVPAIAAGVVAVAAGALAVVSVGHGDSSSPPAATSPAASPPAATSPAASPPAATSPAATTTTTTAPTPASAVPPPASGSAATDGSGAPSLARDPLHASPAPHGLPKPPAHASHPPKPTDKSTTTHTAPPATPPPAITPPTPPAPPKPTDGKSAGSNKPALPF